MSVWRAANAWSDRLPWYVDAGICLVLGTVGAAVCWFVRGDVDVLGLALIAAGVLAGRNLYHRRLRRSG